MQIEIAAMYGIGPTEMLLVAAILLVPIAALAVIVLLVVGRKKP